MYSHMTAYILFAGKYLTTLVAQELINTVSQLHMLGQRPIPRKCLVTLGTQILLFYPNAMNVLCVISIL